MRTIIQLEFLRIVRDRKYWFWACVGVPILIPALFVVIGFSMASLGSVDTARVKPQVAVQSPNVDFVGFLTDEGLDPVTYADREMVDDALSRGLHEVALIDNGSVPEKTVQITVLSIDGSKYSPIYLAAVAASEQFAMNQRATMIEELNFSGPSFDVLLQPIALNEETMPDRLTPGLLQIVVLLWGALLLFPYLVLTWNGGSRLVIDRSSGYLSPINSSSLAPWRWLIARWLTLSAVASLLLVFGLVMLTFYMRAYGGIAQLLVDNGILDSLSSETGKTATSYLVHLVALWRETSVVSLLLWSLLGALQLAAACALIIYGSVKASSLAQYRIYELLPFLVIFVLPMLGLGALGNGLSSSTWVPGLNTVLSLEHVVSGALPGAAFFSSAGVSFLSNLLLTAVFLGLAIWGLRNERLWAV